jgi:tol-pal system protein YbgF
MFRPAAFLLSALLFTSAMNPAFAQDSDEQDVGAARLDVKLAQLQEQMRRMEGTIEQLSYQNKQLKAELDKANTDNQYRLQALETKINAAPVAPAAGATPSAPVAENGSQTVDNGDQMQPVQPAPQEGSADAAPASEQFPSARDHYNYAFRLMNQAKYAEAGGSFAAFTRQYPHDPLIGNAFYWLGETYYVRRDYMQAADNFRQGYEAMPAGPKAADNLLKLAMSLEALKKDKEACIVLHQVETKYGNAPGNIGTRAEQEMNRVGCN